MFWCSAHIRSLLCSEVYLFFIIKFIMTLTCGDSAHREHAHQIYIYYTHWCSVWILTGECQTHTTTHGLWKWWSQHVTMIVAHENIWWQEVEVVKQKGVKKKGEEIKERRREGVVLFLLQHTTFTQLHTFTPGSCPLQPQCEPLATGQLHWSSWG